MKGSIINYKQWLEDFNVEAPTEVYNFYKAVRDVSSKHQLNIRHLFSCIYFIEAKYYTVRYNNSGPSLFLRSDLIRDELLRYWKREYGGCGYRTLVQH